MVNMVLDQRWRFVVAKERVSHCRGMSHVIRRHFVVSTTAGVQVGGVSTFARCR